MDADVFNHKTYTWKPCSVCNKEFRSMRAKVCRDCQLRAKNRSNQFDKLKEGGDKHE